MLESASNQPYGHSVDTATNDTETPGKVALTFRPSVGLITSTRRFVNELLDSMLTDPDAASRVALTIHELLENTLKYSSDGEARLDVDVDLGGGHRVVHVRSTNRTTPDRLDELKRRIDDLRELSDPMALYVSMLAESAQRAGSGLGLARIRVEGEMELAYDIEGDSVTIKCSTPVQ